MDIILIILGLVCVVVGILGCFLPVIPGPPISFLALLFVHWTSQVSLDDKTLWLWGFIMAAVTALDYVIPAYGTKKFGGTKRGVWGSTIGLVAGLIFFPPFGIIIGPFVGAFLGEMSNSSDTKKALRSAFGSFLGFLVGTLLKLIASGWMAWIFFDYAIDMIRNSFG